MMHIFAMMCVKTITQIIKTCRIAVVKQIIAIRLYRNIQHLIAIRWEY